MCNCDPLGQAEDNITRHGWSITAVDSENHESPAFAYTAGLTEKGCPELLCYGLPPRTAAKILNDVAYRMDTGLRFDPGEYLVDVLPDGLAVRLIEVVDPSDMLVTAALYREFTALQVVWPDEYNRFPWDAGFSMCRHHQPLKGVGWV